MAYGIVVAMSMYEYLGNEEVLPECPRRVI
jgi:hypothetical protein